MRLDLYQAETRRIASEQGAILAAARDIFLEGRHLTPLEQGGMLHALQILIENAIGKAKHLLKSEGQDVPISAYDSFKALVDRNHIPSDQLPQWNVVIGLRNRIVHDYMNIDIGKVIGIVKDNKIQFVIDFLCRPFDQ